VHAGTGVQLFSGRRIGNHGRAAARFFRVQQFLVEKTRFYGAPCVTEVHPSACIHPRAWIAERGVRIGPDSVVEANAVIGRAVIVGSHVRIGAGSITTATAESVRRCEPSACCRNSGLKSALTAGWRLFFGFSGTYRQCTPISSPHVYL